MKNLTLPLSLLFIGLLFNCTLFKSKDQKAAEAKMNFTFSKLDKNGLIKKKGTSLAYEFCIPNKLECLDKVKEIDETIAIYKSSTGRIGCGKDEILCIGETGNKEYKTILIQLSKLTYVKTISESFFE